MSEDNQDQLKTTRPGVHIKHSALDAHTLASDNIRKDMEKGEPTREITQEDVKPTDNN